MKNSEHACSVCGKATKNPMCARCRGLWKRLIYVTHKNYLSTERQIEIIREAIAKGRLYE